MKATLLTVLAVLFTLPALAESFTCVEPIGVFDAKTPEKQIGQFNAGTKLSIGKQADVPGMYHVSFMGADGTFIAGLCRAEDIGKAPKSENPGGPKPVIITKQKPARGFEWLDDFEKAKEYARDENKIILMDFTGSDWCGWCIKLDREIFSTPEFKNYAEQNVVLLKLDFPKRTPIAANVKAQNERLASQFGIRGYPTVIILNASGQQIGKMGYMDGGPGPFIEKLKSFKP